MEAPARPPPFLHLGGGTRGSEGDDHRATGIDPNIVKRIREKTVHLRQRMATSTAAQAQSQHLDVLRHDWERRTRTYKEREERYTSEIRELEDAIVAFHAQRLLYVMFYRYEWKFVSEGTYQVSHHHTTPHEEYTYFVH